MEIVQLSQKYEFEYTDFVANHGKGLFYYQLKYRDILKKILSCNDEYYILIDSGKVRAVLPIVTKDGQYGKVYNSLAYYGSNGSILAESTEYYNILLDKYNEIIESSVISTYIENPLFIQEKKPNHDYTSERVCQISELNLHQSMDDISKLFTSNKRNDIRKAIKNDITVEIDNSETAKAFLLVTHTDNIKSVGGVPKNEEFFDFLYNSYIENKDYNIFIAKKGSRNIAGLLVLYSNNATEYYTPVILSEYREFQPLALVIYNAMKISVERKYKYWNWGGNGIALNSVYNFKKRWGAKDYVYKYFIKLNNKILLNLSMESISKEYEGFFTVPFDLLKQETSNEQY